LTGGPVIAWTNLNAEPGAATPALDAVMLTSKFITLVSMDGYEFVVLREAAMVSPFVRRMLDPKSQFFEARTGRCIFADISGVVLEKVVEYFQYWYKNRDKVDVPDLEIPTELCLELLEAADFLGFE